MLDFHAEWCGPCHKVRPAVEQLIRKGYPIKTIDIDQEARAPRSATTSRAFPPSSWSIGPGRELDRTSGLQSAAELARFYKTAAAKARPPANSNAHVGSRDDDRSREPTTTTNRRDADAKTGRKRSTTIAREDEREHAEPAFTNPKPWETVVRIRVIGNRSTGFGSGTVIYSTPEESLILTCAHIFKLDGRKQAPPSQFPRRIMIDLFDGNLKGPSRPRSTSSNRSKGRPSITTSPATSA